jgi:AraC-like DNA-binding protein
VTTLDQSAAAVALPPPWAQRFAAEDLDEVRAFVARTVGEHSRVAIGVGGLGFAQAWIDGDLASVGWIRSRLRTVVRGAVRDPVLHVSVPAGARYRVGRRSVVAHPGSATFVAPGWEYTFDRPPGPAIAVSVKGPLLAAEIAARDPARRGEVAFMTRGVDLGAPLRARVLAALSDVARATHPAAPTSVTAHAEGRLLGVLADVLQGGGAFVRAQPVSLARIADVEAWIDAHLEDPITIGRLCDVAGTGERWLQRVFEARRGMSPMRFVAERRLVEARRRLEGADSREEGVTRVALSLGFGHVGRFAILYRQAFGESPSETIRRKRR